MSWAKISDDLSHHPKFVTAASPPHVRWIAAYGFYVAACGYAKRHLTDGFIPESALPLVMPLGPSRALRQCVDDLLAARFLEPEPGGWRIHDFLDWNDPAAEVKAHRDEERTRVRSWRTYRRTYGVRTSDVRTPRTTPETETETETEKRRKKTAQLGSCAGTPPADAGDQSAGGAHAPAGTDAIGPGRSDPRGEGILPRANRNGFLPEARELLALLNAKAGRYFRDTPTTLEPIRARLRDGATMPECRAVIIRKVREWGGDEKMSHYLRPETLFGARKFAQYMGEIPPAPVLPEETP